MPLCAARQRPPAPAVALGFSLMPGALAVSSFRSSPGGLWPGSRAAVCGEERCSSEEWVRCRCGVRASVAHECMWGLAGVPHSTGGVCLAEVAATSAAVMNFARMRA